MQATPAYRASIAVVVIILLLLTACMNHYGGFTLDPQVGQDFQTGLIKPELQYFYAGRDTMPYAIIGIDRGYSVPSRYWIPFDPEAAQLKKMSGNIYRGGNDNPYGAHILDPDGTVIGVWYANLYRRSVKVDQQNRTVQILFANPESNDHPG